MGVSVLLGPGINLKRSPLGGRNFEYFAEDPLLTGVLAVEWVQGLQSQGVGASLKHFAVNSQETDRMRVSADVDERTLREMYLRAFQRVVDAGPAVDGDVRVQPDQRGVRRQHHWLLTEVLRDEWGFDGLVVSDWGAVVDRVAAVARRARPHHARPRRRRRPRAGRRRRRRHARPGDARTPPPAGSAPWSTGRSQRRPDATYDADAHHALAREVAGRGIVLLKNEGGLLPLAGRRHRDRRHRRVRPHPALPGRRQLPDQPDPAGRRARPRSPR